MERKLQRDLRTRAHLQQRRSTPLAKTLAPLAIAICLVATMALLLSAGKESPQTADDTPQSEGARESNKAATPNSDAATAQGSDSSESAAQDDVSSGATAPTGKSIYRVKSGDNFGGIAEATGVTVAKLTELNPDVDPRSLQPGQRLKLK